MDMQIALLETETGSAERRKRCQACQSATPVFPFSMAFQPIVDLQARRIDSYEALVRSPDGGGAAAVLAQVSADTLYAFDQACRVRAIEMAARLGIDRQLSINFLPNAVYEPRACIRATLEAAERTGFPRDKLTFEIVETEAIADMAHLRNITREYRRQGFLVALDDFGTGYSGLARLAQLNPDIVKLDREVARDCDRDSTRLAIVKAIIGLCSDLGIKVVIEGVERLEEVEALRSVGARFIQGFYFGRPLFEAIAKDSDIFPSGAA
jgi:EAL domain-containing protein (putative c-di-GMP-specific phosphodiesterase class I)